MAITDRMIRASRGEIALFEEVEHDPAATTEAMVVVALVAAAAGIGTALTALGAGRLLPALLLLIGLVIGRLVVWAVFAGATYLIGTRLFHADANWEEVLRTLGYAYSPQVASILGFIPLLGGLISFAAAIWSIYLAFLAIRAALDISSRDTVATILLAIIPSLMASALITFPAVVLLS